MSSAKTHLVLSFVSLNINDMKSINDNAPVTCSKNIAIHAERSKVWALLTHIDNWPGWQTEIIKAKLNGELRPDTTFVWKTGGTKILSTLHTVNPEKEFGWTGKTFGMYAIHNWTLTEQNGITTVIVHESMEGFLASLFKKSFNKNLEKGMIFWLERLKKNAETKI